jgi:ABC-type multidrug transport system ATPase subunit
VYVNSRSLHKHFNALKQDLAVVPQSSVMHDSLTVEQSFGFTSELRLPCDLSREELQTTVDGALRTVGLEQRRTVRISQLSGGQLKRAGLGGELLSEPSLLFLDEVTSGLDEHSDGEMMRLFRSLADAGKTLVCITHNLTHVEENCHLIAVLTVGGRLAFYGPPADAKRYFRIDKLADIYVKLQTQPAERWAEQFRAQPQFAAYIESRKPQISHVDTPGMHDAGRQSRSSMLRQFLVLLRRTIAIWRGDKSALVAFFGQALLVSLLLGLVFGNIADIPAGNVFERLGKIRNLLFLVSVSCFWLGCNNSVKEIVKERPIYRRERDFNLTPEAYLLSKLVFLSAIGVAQSVMLGCIALGWFEMPGGLAEKLLALVALSMAGTALGLAISSISKSEEIAVAIVPIVVIPQIILAGVVATLPSTANWLARIGITVYWGQKAIEQSLPAVDRIASGFEPGYSVSLSVVILHAFVFLSVAWFGVRWKR